MTLLLASSKARRPAARCCFATRWCEATPVRIQQKHIQLALQNLLIVNDSTAANATHAIAVHPAPSFDNPHRVAVKIQA